MKLLGSGVSVVAAGDEGEQRERNLLVLDLLQAHGAKRSHLLERTDGKYVFVYLYIYMGVSILYLSNIIEQELPPRKKGPRFINELDNS